MPRRVYRRWTCPLCLRSLACRGNNPARHLSMCLHRTVCVRERERAKKAEHEKMTTSAPEGGASRSSTIAGAGKTRERA